MREYTCRLAFSRATLTVQAHAPAEAAELYAARNCMNPDEVWEVLVDDQVYVVEAEVEVTYSAGRKL